MTTKRKIIAGFSLLIVLLGLMAYFGFSSLQTATHNFNDYRRLANLNVYSSDLNATANEIIAVTSHFIEDREPGTIAEGYILADRAMELLGLMEERARLQTTLDRTAKAKGLVQELKRQMASLETNLTKLRSIYRDQNLPNMRKADELIANLGKGSRNTKNSESLYFQTVLWRNIATVNSLMTSFYDEIDPDAGQQMLRAFETCEKAMKDAEGYIESEQGIRDYGAMYSAFKAVMDTAGPMVEIGTQGRTSIKVVTEIGSELRELAKETGKACDDLMRTNGSATLASNMFAQTQMLVLSVAGVLLGLAFALFIIISLVRTLAKMSAFATDIAEGNFQSDVRINEKGEIGAMFAALKYIPEIFSGVIERCNDIANDIASGRFRNRLDTGSFKGGFRDLTQGVNTIADSYTATIDNLPVGILTLDTNQKTIFSNAVGGKMVGHDALRAFGGSIAFLDESMRANRAASAESALTSPEGIRIDVAATGLPLKNLKGETAGGLAVLTDISEIKDKQKIMLQVANDASSVSDRVAAAAEQLASQVEEISRGADIQRERVESTASAMTQMNSTVLEVARNAGQAADQTNTTRSSAENGAGLVKQVVGAINEVNAIGNKLQSNMQELGEKAENIGGVMGVISDIADQTNLLALNAAIEAARAGEAGRGFAVVADEVRKLAEKTMAATQEVGDNINSIQHSARVNIDEVGQAVDSVGKATNLANASGQALEEIVSLAASSSSVVSSIATAAEEQSATSEEISSAIDEINRITGETASGMVQSSSAVQELSRMAQELRQIMQSLK